jgi:catechol 2,3-dioxygenase-like lactoylglutathione lyase family enzyme
VAVLPALQSMVAVTYVRDIDASRAFYALLGFREQRAGRAETSAWSSLEHGEHLLLLTATRPPLEIPPLPLLFYFFFDDVDGVLAALTEAGIDVTRLGQAPHALGGEAKVTDPDGNTVLLGQREPSGLRAAGPAGAVSRFSLLREAAAVIAARGNPGHGCRVPDADGQPCELTAEVRLADSEGATAWACIGHAEEVLVMVPGAFVASDEGHGIAAFMARRRG